MADSHRGIKPAKEHMQDMVQKLSEHMRHLKPFNDNGTPRLETGELGLWLQFSRS